MARKQIRGTGWARPRMAQALAIAGVASLLAGCGGGGAEVTVTQTVPGAAAATAPAAPATGAAKPLPAAQSVIAKAQNAPAAGAASSAAGQADVICARRNSELAKIGHVDASSPHVTAIAARRAVVEKRALAELLKISPPVAVEKDWLKVIAYSELALRQDTALGQARKSGDAAASQVAATGWPLRLLVAGAHAGLKSCGYLG